MFRLSFISLTVAIVAGLTLSACNPTTTSSASTSTTAPASQPATALKFASMDALDGFAVGIGANSAALPSAYVLFDPQCPHCAHLWEAAKPLAGKALIKWIPVGMLSGLSSVQAGLLLEAKDPLAMMNTNEATFTNTGHASQVSGDVKKSTQDLVAKNTKMLQMLNATSVPLIVYHAKGSTEISTASGALPTAKLAEILGVAL